MGRVIRGFAAAAATALLLAAPASAASGLVEFRDGLSKDSRPESIARGADGNVWLTQSAEHGRIARVTPAGVITEFATGLSSDAGLRGIAAGPDGNMWFVESKRGAVGRITPSGGISEFTLGISTHSEPQDIVAGPDGNLWFTERAGRIGRITPSGVVTEFMVGLPEGVRPQAITAGPDGNLWFTDASKTSRIGRVTPGGVITMFGGLPWESFPSDITSGADGNLWFTLPRHDKVGRITPAGVVTLFGGMHPHAEPMGIALGPDANLWVTERGAGRIASVSVSGAITEYAASLTLADKPTGITAGPNGSVWFTEAGNPGAVGVINGVGPADSVIGVPPAPETSAPIPGDVVKTGGDSASASIDAIRDLVDGPVGERGEDWSLPTQGVNFLVGAVDGDIYIRDPKRPRSPRLTGLRNIPVGARVDTTRGTIAVMTALPRGRYQLATFKDGRFDARQKKKGNGVTDLNLRGKTGCGGNGEPDEALVRALSSAARPKGRRLWAKDRHGRWRTHGRDSVATVRGTEWITEDRCDGTLTTVVEGAVKVRDRHTGRSVLVRAGHSYLARKR